MIYYKIRNKRTGLYRKGGGVDDWNKSGKVWDTLGKLRSMITNCMHYKNFDFSEWEIIEFEVIEKEIKQVHEIVKADKIIKLLKQ